MRIQCDGCGKEEASSFCCADEAALCVSCDEKVHQANRLAGKHHRFSLFNPSSSKQAPRCDICQERRAILFCQEDRAILCHECDLPIHSANELTAKHNRFLLTGIRVSSSPLPARLPLSSPVQVELEVEVEEEETAVEEEVSLTDNGNLTPAAAQENLENGISYGMKTEDGYTSSLSDYLIKTLPGWHVEDLLDNAHAGGGGNNGFFPGAGHGFPAPADGYYKADDMVSLLDPSFGSGYGFGLEAALQNQQQQVFQVPQISFLHDHHHHDQINTISSDQSSSVIVTNCKKMKDPKDVNHHHHKMMKTQQQQQQHWVVGGDDGGFTVPQMSPQLKRVRWA